MFRSAGSLHEQRRQLPPGPLRRRGEVEVEPLLLGVADEVPVRVETPAVAVAELVQNDPAQLADTGGHFQEFNEILRREAARERFTARW